MCTNISEVQQTDLISENAPKFSDEVKDDGKFSQLNDLMTQGNQNTIVEMNLKG